MDCLYMRFVARYSQMRFVVRYSQMRFAHGNRARQFLDMLIYMMHIQAVCQLVLTFQVGLLL